MEATNFVTTCSYEDDKQKVHGWIRERKEIGSISKRLKQADFISALLLILTSCHQHNAPSRRLKRETDSMNSSHFDVKRDCYTECG